MGLQKYRQLWRRVFDRNRGVKEIDKSYSHQPIQNSDKSKSQILLNSVNELSLSVRSANCLEASNIQHIGELIQFTEEELLALPNFGLVSLNEIKSKLSVRGLSLESQLEDRQVPDSVSLNDTILSNHVNSLNLSVRSANCLEAGNIQHIGELIQCTEEELMALPNFGRTSLNEIKSALSAQALSIGMTLDNWCRTNVAKDSQDKTDTNDFARLSTGVMKSLLREDFEQTLRKTNDIDRCILMERLGYEGEIETLENIGKRLNLTRERIRQRYKKCRNRIARSESWPEMIDERIQHLLDENKQPIHLEFLEIEDQWFRGFGSNYTFLSEIIQNFSGVSMNVTSIEGRQYVTRINQNQWNSLNRSLKIKLRHMADERRWSRSEIFQYFDAHLFEYKAQELVTILEEKYKDSLHYTDDGPEALLVAYGKSVDSIVAVVMFQANSPLHYSEVTRRVSEISSKFVDERRVHASLTHQDFWMFDRGVYGTLRHCSLSASERKRICSEVERLLGDAPINKQWHSNEIVQQLEANHLTGKELDPYILRMCIEKSPKIAYLNRMVWARADSGMAIEDRRYIADSLIGILEKEGKPLSGRELKRRLSKIRGLSKTGQIHGNDRLVSVKENYWGLSDWQNSEVKNT